MNIKDIKYLLRDNAYRDNDGELVIDLNDFFEVLDEFSETKTNLVDLDKRLKNIEDRIAKFDALK